MMTPAAASDAQRKVGLRKLRAKAVMTAAVMPREASGEARKPGAPDARARATAAAMAAVLAEGSGETRRRSSWAAWKHVADPRRPRAKEVATAAVMRALAHSPCREGPRSCRLSVERRALGFFDARYELSVSFLKPTEIAT